MFYKIIFLLYFISTSSIFGHDNKKKALKAHEHGVGILKIAQDNNTLVFEFEIPGSDIVGFEYIAKSEQDIDKVERKDTEKDEEER